MAMPELRTVGSILEDYSAAERELARAPEVEWLAILAIMDQLYTEFLEAVAQREAIEEPLSTSRDAFSMSTG
jgi:hypothetical protein